MENCTLEHALAAADLFTEIDMLEWIMTGHVTPGRSGPTAALPMSYSESKRTLCLVGPIG